MLPLSAILPGRHVLLECLTRNAGTRTVLLDMLSTYAEELSEEPGTEMFIVGLNQDDDSAVWLNQILVNDDAEEANRASERFPSLMLAVSPVRDATPAAQRTTPPPMGPHEVC